MLGLKVAIDKLPHDQGREQRTDGQRCTKLTYLRGTEAQRLFQVHRDNGDKAALDEVLQNIFSRKGVPRDLLNYLAPEFKKTSGISEELKSYVNNK